MKFDSGKILIRPRITEKASSAEMSGVRVFEVSKFATKPAVSRAVREIYKVNPRKVNIVKLPAKKIFSKGKRGVTGGVTKAYIYLKAGDKIE